MSNSNPRDGDPRLLVAAVFAGYAVGALLALAVSVVSSAL